VEMATYGMPVGGTRWASMPVCEPIHAHVFDRSRRRVATASPGLVWPPVPPPAMTTWTGPAFTRSGPWRGEARGRPHLRVAARRGEAGDRVDLVHEETIALEEEIDAGHARAVDGAEGS